jgi:ABC-2 type transport system permease protein
MRLHINPVLMREARVRMRGWRAPGLITLYIGVMGLVAWLIVTLANQGGPTFAPEMGGIIFAVLSIVQFALLCFSAPGLTAGAIAGERERQTLDLLLITRMSPLQVVMGKLFAAVAFTLLLMVASLPVYSLLFLLGGIAMKNLLQTLVVYVVTVFLLGSLGIYFSAVFKRTQAAVIASYGLAAAWGILTFVISMLVIFVFTRSPDTPPQWVALLGYVNPAFGLGAAMGGPVAEMTELYRQVLPTPEARLAIWWKYSLFAVGMTGLLVWLTSRRIRPFQDR